MERTLLGLVEVGLNRCDIRCDKSMKLDKKQ